MRTYYAILALIALLLAYCILVATQARADYKAAVVRLPSHGCSGTVIATSAGQSLILSCAHAFQGSDRNKPLAVDAPCPAPGAAQKVGVQLLAVDHQADLSLIRLNAGPLPYVAPVAPSGARPAVCWSVGYDEMKLPPTMRVVRIKGYEGSRTLTYERPWHGRSGGGLFAQQSGYLVGVVSGYTGPPTRHEVFPGSVGIYASHSAILRFLNRHAPGQGVALGEQGLPSPFPAIPIEQQYGPPSSPVPFSPPLIERFYGPAPSTPWCPGGT